MKRRQASALFLAAALALPFGAFAHGHSGGRGWHGGGGWHGSPGVHHFYGHPGFHHHFRPGPVIGFGIVGAPAFFYPDYPPYVYAPAVPAAPPPPPVYIEQYPWDPTPGVTGVVCPSAGMAPYPQVTQCPGGWARVVSGPSPG